MRVMYVPAIVLAGCGASQRPAVANEGTIAGLARDHDTGDPIAKAEIRIRGAGEIAIARAATTDRAGLYEAPHLRPGRYTVTASFAGQPIEVDDITVRAGNIAVVDLTFTLGRPDPQYTVFSDPKSGAISRFRSPHVAAEAAIIEGSVADSATRAPVVGAAVTATGPGGGAGSSTVETITDDLGHYRFELVPPGAYTVSAYYSIGGRGQIEVRRGGIEVDGGGGVIVPLWVELEKP
ncbi:MAG TPA: carboxypeptidase-like regulatory domain-containing protein [Kofleriaceae bacterium]|nr:carboxypeptidase-like regulatory domain-containing protein [Kofleriaceae bacterium]